MKTHRTRKRANFSRAFSWGNTGDRGAVGAAVSFSMAAAGQAGWHAPDGAGIVEPKTKGERDMEHRIFLVEDDRSLADAICAQMKLWALDCVCAADFRAVMAEFARVQPHLVLMDVSLPYMSGYHWCAEIRRVSSVPVIFISSASDNMNIIMAMNMGGDDFVAKPFDTNVLIAKVQALLRRTYEFGAAAPLLEHAGAILNTGDNTLTYAGEHIPLTKNEYRILLTLMQNKGKIVSREKLMEALW